MSEPQTKGSDIEIAERTSFLQHHLSLFWDIGKTEYSLKTNDRQIELADNGFFLFHSLI